MTFSFYSNGIQFNGGGVTPPGEYVTPDGVQTLTNKTIDADDNTLKNIGLDELEDGLVLQDVGDVDTAGADKLVSQLAVAKAVDTVVFDQGETSDTWVIVHNLNKYPSVTVVDSAGTQFIAQIEYNSRNQLTVHLNGSTTGKAYLN